MGVESGLQVDELMRLRCRLAQGYFLARPADAATIAALLRGAGGPTILPAEVPVSA